MKLNVKKIRSLVNEALLNEYFDNGDDPTERSTQEKRAIELVIDSSSAFVDRLDIFRRIPIIAQISAEKPAIQQAFKQSQEGLRALAASLNGKGNKSEARIREIAEPFELDIVSRLVALNNELDKVAFSGDEKFDKAFEEITAAHTAIARLVGKLKQPARQRPIAARQAHAEAVRKTLKALVEGSNVEYVVNHIDGWIEVLDDMEHYRDYAPVSEEIRAARVALQRLAASAARNVVEAVQKAKKTTKKKKPR